MPLRPPRREASERPVFVLGLAPRVQLAEASKDGHVRVGRERENVVHIRGSPAAKEGRLRQPRINESPACVRWDTVQPHVRPMEGEVAIRPS